MKPKVVRIDFERLPVEKAAREKTLEQHDAFLHTVLEMLHPRKLALIYASSPISSLSDEEKVAVAKAQKAAKQEEAKVALELRSVKYRSDEDLQDPAKENGTVVVGGLFHRYQFFTPAIFMGYMALFLMLAILYVGLSAVSSIEVSYGAFEKDMGPAAAKKQQ